MVYGLLTLFVYLYTPIYPEVLRIDKKPVLRRGLHVHHHHNISYLSNSRTFVTAAVVSLPSCLALCSLTLLLSVFHLMGAPAIPALDLVLVKSATSRACCGPSTVPQESPPTPCARLRMVSRTRPSATTRASDLRPRSCLQWGTCGRSTPGRGWRVPTARLRPSTAPSASAASFRSQRAATTASRCPYFERWRSSTAHWAWSTWMPTWTHQTPKSRKKPWDPRYEGTKVGSVARA